MKIGNNPYRLRFLEDSEAGVALTEANMKNVARKWSSMRVTVDVMIFRFDIERWKHNRILKTILKNHTYVAV